MPDNEESMLRRVRLEKIDKIKSMGLNPFPNYYEKTHTNAQVSEQAKDVKNEEKTSKKASVTGRIMAKRDMGALTFMDLRDDTGKMQLYINKPELDKQSQLILEQIDIGDFIGAKGVIYRTKRGEASIYSSELTMLAKSINPLPAKWHGLKDVEIKYRQRYLDIIMNPEVKERFVKKTRMLKEFRNYMDTHGFMEVQTPILQNMYGGALAEPFKTHHNALNTDFYLRIAPELYLKRLMVAGFEKVYEIGPNFRNEGFDASHLQEIPNAFEFYWAYENYEQLMKYTEEMIETVLTKTLGTTKITYENKTIDFKPPYPRITFRQAVLNETGIDIDKQDTYEKLSNEIKRLKVKNININKCKNYGALLDEFYKRTVRQKIITQPTFITNYPIDMKPLAKRNEKDKTKSNAFQLLVNTWELVNAYDELNDPLDQRKRLEEQAEHIKAGDAEAHPLDEDFIEAMEYGMPPIAGFGMGLDRFFTLVLGFDNVRESVFFPTLKPESQKQ